MKIENNGEISALEEKRVEWEFLIFPLLLIVLALLCFALFWGLVMPVYWSKRLFQGKEKADQWLESGGEDLEPNHFFTSPFWN